MTLNFQYENARRDKLYGTAHSFHEDSDDAEDTLQNEKNQEQIRIWGLEGKTKEEIEALGDRVSRRRSSPCAVLTFAFAAPWIP